MKVIILFILFFTYLSAQNQVISVTKDYGTKILYDSKNSPQIYNPLGNKGDGVDTSAALATKELAGAYALYFKGDTTSVCSDGANISDSCLTIYFQQFAFGVGWCKPYDYTVYGSKIDTVARSFINDTTSTEGFWMSMSNVSSDESPCDSVRWIFGIGVGDSLDFIFGVKRQ